MNHIVNVCGSARDDYQFVLLTQLRITGQNCCCCTTVSKTGTRWWFLIGYTDAHWLTAEGDHFCVFYNNND